MISAWKRLTSKRAEEVKSPFPNGVSVLEDSIQKKFAKGVQYNMKIIIRGDRNTGKSCLFHRLQGKPFQEQYIPTHQIQVCCINWNSSTVDGAVKVDVWDVVDKGQRKRLPSDKLKIQNDESKETPNEPTLDADFMDVYKGAHGVLMTFDITKKWTWSYIEKELPRVPHHIPVLVLANFRDMGEHRLVLNDEAAAFVQYFERPTGSAEIYYSEASLKNGFGLRFVHSFLNMPFLILQRETLLQQLERNNLLLDEYREKLYPTEESEDQNYEMFMDQLKSNSQSRGSSPTVEQTNGTDSPVQHSVAESSQTPPQVAKSKQTPSPVPVLNHHTPASGDIHEFVAGDNLEESFLDDEPNHKSQYQQQAVSVPDDDSDSDDGNPLVMQFQDLDSDAEDMRQRIDSKGIEDSSEDDQETDVFKPQEHSAAEVIPVKRKLSTNEDVLGNFDPTEINEEVTMPSDFADGDTPAANQPMVSLIPTQEHSESDDEEDDGPSYQIAQDVDLDGSDDEDEEQKPKQEEKPNKPAKNNQDSAAPSFDIDVDSLELFMSDQLRKASVSSVEDKATSSSSKNTSIVSNPDSEKKKKKKSKKSSSKTTTTTTIDGSEKIEKKKRKSKSKDGKKKKEKSDADYELF